MLFNLFSFKFTVKDARRQANQVEAVSGASYFKFAFTFSLLKALLMSIRC